MEFQWLNFLPSNWVSALYTTLFHSLWMGVVMALVAGVIVMGTKNSSPSLRYNLLTTLLGMFSLSMIFVFYQSLNKVNLLAKYLNPEVSNSSQLFKINFVSDINNLLTTLGTYADQILLLWFAVIFVKAARLMIGLRGVHHLKHAKIFDAGSYWQNKVNKLSQQLFIKESVQILQSGIAKIPMVIGHFKPIILMPIGMLNHLSLTEVEAILSHELAHIKRRDYLVNIFQNVLEMVFFFNPAVLWISNMIKEERENCCDDLAISCTNDKNGYLKALVSCQEFNLNATGFAMSMANGKSQLISRIRRIAFNKRASLGGIEKTMLAMSLLFVFALSAAFTLSGSSVHKTKAITKMVQKVVTKETTETTTENSVAVVTVKQVRANAAVSKRPLVRLNNVIPPVSIQNTIVNTPEKVQSQETCTPTPVTPVAVQTVKFSTAPVSKTVSTTVSTTTTTVKVDGKVVVYLTHQGKDARSDIKKDMLNDSIIAVGETPTYILNRNEMLVNGVKQDACTHQKYKEKYITRPDTQYRIGS